MQLARTTVQQRRSRVRLREEACDNPERQALVYGAAGLLAGGAIGALAAYLLRPKPAANPAVVAGTPQPLVSFPGANPSAAAAVRSSMGCGPNQPCPLWEHYFGSFPSGSQMFLYALQNGAWVPIWSGSADYSTPTYDTLSAITGPTGYTCYPGKVEGTGGSPQPVVQSMNTYAQVWLLRPGASNWQWIIVGPSPSPANAFTSNEDGCPVPAPPPAPGVVTSPLIASGYQPV